MAPAAPTDEPSNTDHKLVLQSSGFLHGIFLDVVNGPVQSGRRVIELFQPTSDQVQELKGIVVEDDHPTSVHDARYVHAGWPSLTSLPSRPWSALSAGTQSSTEPSTGKWATRRLLSQKWQISAAVEDLCPVQEFTNSVQDALGKATDAARIRSLQEVFATWGDMIPLVVVVGASLAATGVLPPDAELGSSSSCRCTGRTTKTDLNSLIDAQLNTNGRFQTRLRSHIQGGKPTTFVKEGLDAWLESVETSTNWEIVKVIRAVPIIDILDCSLQRRVRQLFANPGVIFRSPPVGVSRQFDFDGAVSGLQTIRQIIIGCSDARIERLTVRYASGVVAGPHGLPRDPTRADTFNLGPDEYITDMLVWATDIITSLQLVKNTGHVSPIYGAARIVNQEPVLLSGGGSALMGLSGSFDAAGISQIQGVWRGDIASESFRRTHTTSAGGTDGNLFNDLRFLGDRSTGRITQITARTPATGYIGGLQTTYVSLAGGTLVRQETAMRGWENGQRTTWTLEDGEYITAVRGRHDGTSLCELIFTTNRPNRESPAFGMASGNLNFSFNAPKGRDGRDMMLHYMVGKSLARVNSITFVWAEQPESSVQLCG